MVTATNCATAVVTDTHTLVTTDPGTVHLPVIHKNYPQTP
jgi:hypothetical protein